ncbi:MULTISPECIES: DUF4870 domain-containing protein [Pedobacter]|uniref:DUF4870 domain-containing protein n=1 Tax=Pedobacter TaxID=84567 RepID=UPI001E450BA1|nr:MULTISPECIES: DUF4870 domain-containing protein [Pedobacter]
METNKNFTTTDNGKTAGIVSYFTIIGWLIAYFALHKDNKTELGSYQLRQTLLFAIVSTVLGWGLAILLTVLIVSTNIASLGIIGTIVQIGLFVLWIIGLIGAINGQKKPIPLIGEKAQTMFPGI